MYKFHLKHVVRNRVHIMTDQRGYKGKVGPITFWTYDLWTTGVHWYMPLDICPGGRCLNVIQSVVFQYFTS